MSVPLDEVFELRGRPTPCAGHALFSPASCGAYLRPVLLQQTLLLPPRRPGYRRPPTVIPDASTTATRSLILPPRQAPAPTAWATRATLHPVGVGGAASPSSLNSQRHRVDGAA